MKIIWDQYTQRSGWWLRIGNRESYEFDHDFGHKLVEISQWCDANKCGIRMSYELFQFESEQQMAFFLLKWG